MSNCLSHYNIWYKYSDYDGLDYNIENMIYNIMKIEARAYGMNTSCAVSSRDPLEFARLKAR